MRKREQGTGNGEQGTGNREHGTVHKHNEWENETLNWGKTWLETLTLPVISLPIHCFVVIFYFVVSCAFIGPYDASTEMFMK